MISPRVVIAEDEPELRGLFAEALEGAGFKVATAANGEQALALLKSHPGVEVLLSDIRMPVMDGYTLAESSLKLRPELKILLLSGFEDQPPANLLLARELRAIHKPIRLDRLCAMVDGMLARP
jgi:two-component system, cell cycle sensor histidine kinase and response regulator CckA